MRCPGRSLHLVAQAAMVVASTTTYGGNVLADVSKNDEIEIKTDGSLKKPKQKDEQVQKKSVDTSYLDDCGVWLAPSTLQGAGLGIFAGKDYNKHDQLLPTGDVVIPIVDIMMHQRGRPQWTFLWDEYTWNGESLGMGHEVIQECNAASPGFGAAANSFLDLINVDEGEPDNDIPHNLHRSRDPGVGAFSTYHNRQVEARMRIRAGQELFVNYGEHWFEQRARLGPIPLRRGLKKSTSFYRRFQQVRDGNPRVKSEIFQELWDTFVKRTAFNESRIFGAFKHTEYERENLEKNYTLNQIRRKESERPVQYLKEYGTCGDLIREDLSTIRQAGRGAFATRDLPEGARVSPLPLIHIGDRSVLEMYEFVDIKSKKREQRRLAGYQLLVNYCFGHTNSTLLLCPYGPLSNLVNHNQTRANVKLIWSDPKKGNHESELLAKDVVEFSNERTAKLSMDLVAIRDIEEGEELFLDYGDAWEKAWQNHIRQWESPEGASDYISAFQLNEEAKTARFRTEFEQMMKPYPGNVNVECDSEIWTRINQTLFEITGKINITKPDEYEYWVCDILRHRQVNDTILYTVVVTRPPGEMKKKKGEEDEKALEPFVKLADIPQMAIRFTDRPYTTDQFLKNAFRHPIQIPEKLFPEKWKNWSPIL